MWNMKVLFLTTLCFCTFFFCFLSFFNRFTKIFFVFLFWQVYPDKNHGILGINTRRHLFSTIEDFLTECNEGYSTKFGRLPEVKEGKWNPVILENPCVLRQLVVHILSTNDVCVRLRWNDWKSMDSYDSSFVNVSKMLVFFVYIACVEGFMHVVLFLAVFHFAHLH